MSLLPLQLWIPAAFALGCAIGSFLNVVAWRWPRGESIVWPGSHCPSCNHAIAPWDNVPLFSYLWLRARCRHCKAPISARYPLVELTTGLTFAAIAARHDASPYSLLMLLFAAALIAAALIDFDHGLIPDEISLGGLAVGLVMVPLARAAGGEALRPALVDSVAGAALGGGLLWITGFLHARVAVALGRRFEHWPGPGAVPPKPSELDYWLWFPGLGFGDVKLLAMIGAFLGLRGVVFTLLAASLAGIALGLAHAAHTRRLTSPFGLGPAIAVGALLVVLARLP
jgi:leader peptidase (prepilin peptidase)/N-methyltransferase